MILTAQDGTRSKRQVFLVHGRDVVARQGLVDLLRAFDLRVVGWEEAAAATGTATPYTGDVVTRGMAMSDAVVVLLTPDDLGCVQPHFRQERDGTDELELSGQARLNVVFEAGMAMALDRSRVVMVEMGAVRQMSDTAGLNVVRLQDALPSRRTLGNRLRTAGLDVHFDNDDWPTAGKLEVTLRNNAEAPAVPSTRLEAKLRDVDGAEPAMGAAPANAVTRLKEYLPDSRQRLRLEELVTGLAEDVFAAVDQMPTHVGALSGEVLQRAHDERLHVVRPLLEVLAAGVRYDRQEEYADLWVDVLRRLMQARKALPGGQPFDSVIEALRQYPALLALRTAGVTAVHTGHDGVLIRLLRDASWRDWAGAGARLPAAVALHDLKVLDPQAVNAFPRWSGNKWLYPASHLLRAALRPVVAAVIPDEDDYRWACDRYEYRVALFQLRYVGLPGAYRSAAGEFIGERQWGLDRKPLAEADFAQAAANAADDWPGSP